MEVIRNSGIAIVKIWILDYNEEGATELTITNDSINLVNDSEIKFNQGFCYSLKVFG